MIKFWADGNNAKIHVEHGVYLNDQGFEFQVTQTQPYQATLLTRAFQDHLNRELKRLKEKYYNEGWKQAKAKARKRTGFYGGWEKP